ncbi:MAG: mechanosensitive ion channel [Chitinophagaceae bacterium]|nr:mechanosensitive ion channel [Chitinophagaceae bacterium]
MLTLPPELVLPLDLQIPLGGLLLALLSWVGLEVVGRRCRPRSLLRGLLLTSRLSVTSTCLLAGLGWWLALQLDPLVIDLERDGHEVRELLVALGAAWTLLRWHSELRRNRARYAEEILPRLNEQDRHFLFDVLQKLISIAIWAIVVYELMQLVGVSAAVLVTAGGFGAAAVGFGAQGIVSNSLSGLSLYVNRPFIVDDFIEIPAEQLSGTVEEIGWFYTRLRNRERQPVYVPNTIFTKSPVINNTAVDNRRVWIDFNLRFADRPRVPAIVAELEQLLADHPGVAQHQTRAVHVTGYGESSLKLRLLCFSAGHSVEEGWGLQQELLLAIGAAVQRHGAAMPFPSRTLFTANPLTPAPDGLDRP